MAIIDVVKLELKDYEFCKKFPSEDLRVGSQLVVYGSQVAIFVKGGQVYDTFTAGTYTLTTDNIPLLNKVVNIPFGGNSPFQAEVWFVNLTSKLNMKWGTTSPIQLEDPKYNIIVPVRAYGQYGLRVSSPARFLQTLIGNMNEFLAYKIAEYFKGIMLSNLNVAIGNKIVQDRISILEVNLHLLEMSSFCNEVVNKSFERYGLELVEFTFISINVPEDDPSVKRLKEAKDFAARLMIMGAEGYQLDRSFSVLEKAASNEGAAGAAASMGVGVGLSSSFMSSAANVASVATAAQHTPPPLPSSVLYHVYLNGQQISGQSIDSIASLIRNGSAKEDTLVWKPGMDNWKKISEVPELAGIIGSIPPPLPL